MDSGPIFQCFVSAGLQAGASSVMRNRTTTGSSC